MTRFAWLFIGLTASALGCHDSGAKQEGNPPSLARSAAAHTDEPEHEALPRRVRVSEQVINDAGIRTEPVSRQVLAQTMSLPGEVSGDPDKIASISSPVAGRLERIQFREGSTVKRGQALAVLRVPDLGKVKADFAGSKAKAAAARINAERLAQLASKGLASNQEVLTAQAEALALEAQAQGAGESLRAAGSGVNATNSELVVRAPISGVVTMRHAIVGQSVTPEDVMGTIIDLSEAWFLARVFEKDLERLKTGANAEIRFNAFSDRRFVGTVEYVGKQIDPVARTLTARIRVQNSDDVLRVGLFGTASVEVASTAPRAFTLVVPQSALVNIAGKQAVFVKEPDGDFEYHEVELGTAALGKAQVVSGLREGEPVVVEGAFTLKSLVLKSTFGEEE
jgi:membrane fusion protein, heavy metal efflux system